MSEIRFEVVDLPQQRPWPDNRPPLAVGVAAALERARGALRRTVYTVCRGDRSAAALGMHRPATAQQKLTALTGDPELYAGLLEQAAAHAADTGAVSVKLELPAGDEAGRQAAIRAGFKPLHPPVLGAPVTDDPAGLPEGFVQRIGGWTGPELGYYRQTTDFTCGPVAALTALHGLGLAPALTRAAELQLWRESTSVPACDPFGLALGLRRRGVRPRVVVNTTEPLLLSADQPGWQTALHDFVQAGFRRDAAQAGLAVELREFDAAEIRDLVADGDTVLLLIDELVMHGEACPHWVVVHGGHDDILLVEDPWTDADLGETWVDAHQLPVRADDLAGMSGWGDPAYRAMVVLHPPRPAV